MQLIKNIQVYSKFDVKDKIQLSEGVSRGVLTGKFYAQNSFVPNLTWRPLTSSEKEIVITKDVDPTDYNNHISVIKIPQKLKDNVAEFFTEISPTNKNTHFFSDDTFLYYTNDIINYIKKNYLIKEDKFQVTGYAIGDSYDSITGSFDYDNNEFVGMHIDTWKDVGLADIKNHFNRFSVNVGKEKRYFLFVNLTLSKILEMCSITDPAELDMVNKYPSALSYHFFQKFPDYPVLRIQLDPGEGYISPVGNIIHDGSTFGNTNTDINFNASGYFKLY